MLTHVDDHADGGKGGRQVLRVGRPHGHGDDTRVQAAVEGSYQINTCTCQREAKAVSTKLMKSVRGKKRRSGGSEVSSPGG